MKIIFISPFCGLLKELVSTSILKRASEKNLVEYVFLDLFSFSNDANKRIDDSPYGGGNGMVMTAQPIIDAYNFTINELNCTSRRVIYPTPDGRKLNHEIATNLSNQEALIFICGHYKGVDQRIRDSIVTDEISIGDYVITGGELASSVILDSTVRLIPGVINSIESAKTDSFYDGLLDCSYYTRPEEYNNMKVPDVLLSGNHEKIKKWRLEERINKTKSRRQDLYKIYNKEKNHKVDSNE